MFTIWQNSLYQGLLYQGLSTYRGQSLFYVSEKQGIRYHTLTHRKFQPLLVAGAFVLYSNSQVKHFEQFKL